MRCIARWKATAEVFLVDTNILLYAVNPDSPEHEAAYAAVEEWRAGEQSWYLTWGIIYEFLRVSTHSRIFAQPLRLRDAQAWIGALLNGARAGILVESDRHAAVVEELVGAYPRAAGNLLHDFHIAALMKEHGLEEIRTADADFHQFSFLRVVNPLTQNS